MAWVRPVFGFHFLLNFVCSVCSFLSVWGCCMVVFPSLCAAPRGYLGHSHRSVIGCLQCMQHVCPAFTQAFCCPAMWRPKAAYLIAGLELLRLQLQHVRLCGLLHQHFSQSQQPQCALFPSTGQCFNVGHELLLWHCMWGWGSWHYRHLVLYSMPTHLCASSLHKLMTFLEWSIGMRIVNWELA